MTSHNNISEQDWEQLELYLSGKMAPAEHDAFRARLNADAALQEARLLIIGIQEASLTEKLDAFHGHQTAKLRSMSPKNNALKYWLATAAASIIVIVSVVLSLNKPEDRSLAMSYFEPDPGLPTTMGTADNYALERGMVDYKTGKYKEALDAWRPIMAANDTVHYFAGVSYIALNKADSAEHYLRQVWNNNGSNFRSDAGWYLSLSLLSQGKKEEAKSLLNQINHPKKEELLSRIK